MVTEWIDPAACAWDGGHVCPHPVTYRLVYPSLSDRRLCSTHAAMVVGDHKLRNRPLPAVVRLGDAEEVAMPAVSLPGRSRRCAGRLTGATRLP